VALDKEQGAEPRRDPIAKEERELVEIEVSVSENTQRKIARRYGIHGPKRLTVGKIDEQDAPKQKSAIMARTSTAKSQISEEEVKDSRRREQDRGSGESRPLDSDAQKLKRVSSREEYGDEM
jgi:hypothetical protein